MYRRTPFRVSIRRLLQSAVYFCAHLGCRNDSRSYPFIYNFFLLIYIYISEKFRFFAKEKNKAPRYVNLSAPLIVVLFFLIRRWITLLVIDCQQLFQQSQSDVMPKITRESLRLDGYNIFNLGLSSNFAVRHPVTKLKRIRKALDLTIYCLYMFSMKPVDKMRKVIAMMTTMMMKMMMIMLMLRECL